MEKKWFRRKTYGYGWFPITRAGWALTLGYTMLILIYALSARKTGVFSTHLFTFLLPIIILTIAFLGIAYKTGEPLKWQWGEPKKSKLKGVHHAKNNS